MMRPASEQRASVAAHGWPNESVGAVVQRQYSCRPQRRVPRRFAHGKGDDVFTERHARASRWMASGGDACKRGVFAGGLVL